MYGVNNQMIQALKSLYRRVSNGQRKLWLRFAYVRINGSYTDWFNIQRVVRQGFLASPWLFNLFLDSSLNECGLRMGELLFKYLLYLRNQVLIASSEKELQDMVTCMNGSLKFKGTKSNVNKTKMMVFEKEVSKV